MRVSLVNGLAVLTLAAPAARAQSAYKKELPDSLVRRAKTTEEIAAARAQKRVPKGAISAVELERENGRLIYSYVFKVPGKSGVDEVNVDAVTGKVAAVEHESPAAKKKEAAADAKRAAAKPKKP